MKQLIANGRVIDPATQLDSITNVYIEGKKIVAIADQLDDFVADKTIDASGLIVCPGLIDLSARLREPGQEHTATIHSETLAAAAGGITTLAVPPDTDPVIDTPAVIELIEDRAKKAARTMVLTVGALTQGLKGDLLAEMAALKKAGCVGVSNSLYPIKNSLVWRRAMEYAASLELTLFINPIDPWLQAEGCVHEGKVSARLGLPGIPETAETIAVARDLLLIKQTKVKAHFHNISTASALKMIEDAKQQGLDVSADVSVHHLHLTEQNVSAFDSQCHILPPLRTESDREQLRLGVQQGGINAINSNHQPLDKDAKLGPFADTTAGISGLETLLPLTMKLVHDKQVDIQQALAALTCNPADILGIDAGRLKVGAAADICIFNDHAEYACQPDQFVSAGHNSPYTDWCFNHQVQYTFFHGKQVYSAK
jgi:dihydroorotase